ncbi:MAG: gluconate 2-dehydrogenase subunit 3 family protein [Saprospiraceae bacterium]|nr:gluconate 2-dehydrogenase subunit 3 family protein [Saprospiraceae bacterium]
MERRKVIKNIALSLGSLVTMPAWASGWNVESIHTTPDMPNEALLAELVETIIPKTQTSGAKDLGVHQFIQKIVTDCFDKKAQDNFAQVLGQIDPLSIKAFGKPFAQGDAAQRISVLQNLSKSEDKNQQDFYRTLRGLTIQGYTSSEYYMTKFTDYEMAPARYLGCVPVKK